MDPVSNLVFLDDGCVCLLAVDVPPELGGRLRAERRAVDVHAVPHVVARVRTADQGTLVGQVWKLLDI